jgi:hypothetical protein
MPKIHKSPKTSDDLEGEITLVHGRRPMPVTNVQAFKFQRFVIDVLLPNRRLRPYVSPPPNNLEIT